MSKSRRFCFTINNFTPETETLLAGLADTTKYLVYGKETGNNGTPHLQGFVIFNNSVQVGNVSGKLGGRAHVEVARGTSQQASDYCKKDGEFVEYGELPTKSGQRNDWVEFQEWVTSLGRLPSQRELASTFPSLYARYSKRCYEIANAVLPSPNLTSSSPREGWQDDLIQGFDEEASSREISFIVDPQGNSGKTWVCQYMMTHHDEKTQILRIGKRDDLAHAIDVTKSIFLIDVPRGQTQFLQYTILESLKDQMIFSPKYESSLKILRTVPHVVVFMNETPDMNALTMDRYKIVHLGNHNI